MVRNVYCFRLSGKFGFTANNGVPLFDDDDDDEGLMSHGVTRRIFNLFRLLVLSMRAQSAAQFQSYR
jgi:hypothetical protein